MDGLKRKEMPQKERDGIKPSHFSLKQVSAVSDRYKMGTGWIIYCLAFSLSFSDIKTKDLAANQLVDYEDSHVSYYITFCKMNNVLMKGRNEL